MSKTEIDNRVATNMDLLAADSSLGHAIDIRREFCREAAAELRRLDAENKALRARLEAQASSLVDDDGCLSEEVRELITGMTVSVDVSTGEHDAGNRLFGEVTEVMEYDGGSDKHKVVLLVQSPEANFKTTPAADVELLELAQAIVKFNREHGSILAVHINNLADLVDERALQAAAKTGDAA